MTNIHPSSVIDENVQLGSNVRIGPMCVIRGPVVIGDNTTLIGHCWIDGPLILGKDNLLHPFVRLGGPPQHTKHEWVKPDPELPGVLVGNNNVFREHSTVHAPIGQEKTFIGDNNYMMAGSHVGHDCVIKKNVIIGHAAALGGHCQVFDNVNISGHAAIHQHVRLGEGAMIGANNFVTKDIPPWSMVMVSRRVSSLNSVGMKRFGLKSEERDLYKHLFSILYGGFSLKKAKEEIFKIKQPHAVSYLDFLNNSSRGITPGPLSATK